MRLYNEEEHPIYFEEDSGPLTGAIVACGILGFIVAAIVCIVSNADKIDLFFTNLLTR